MEGKIIIVGATGYTGSALAKLLKKENIDCHLIGRNELELKKLATETNQSFSVCMDVSNEQSVEDSLKNVANDKILGFAYCVGSIVLKSFQTTKIDDFINTFSLNVAGAIHFIKKLQKQLADNKGSIVLFSTVAVDRGFNMHSVISTAKGAIQGLTTSLAAEFAPKIRVNCIAPSISQSKMAKPILDNARIAEQIPLKHAMKRVGKPEDLAEAAKFLLLPSSSWITGQVIHVDGGKINIET
ncbi:MAG: SDR family oxidoreductase [Proteobacteria bacterium]|jgi:NAD(P)-dependent dehydrogenase (short-subunit alcohol dehydrogenase family)|nr:SDR family oxidoreductase [Candidatus Fonsibacter sp. PEL4]